MFVPNAAEVLPRPFVGRVVVGPGDSGLRLDPRPNRALRARIPLPPGCLSGTGVFAWLAWLVRRLLLWSDLGKADVGVFAHSDLALRPDRPRL